MERTKKKIIKEYLNGELNKEYIDGELNYINAIMELEELGYSWKEAEVIIYECKPE